MSDYQNLHVSAEATANIETLKDKYKFSTFASALKFAIIYALKYHKNDMDFDQLDKLYPSDGTNLHVGTVDEDGILRRLIPILYKDCDTPYRYARVAAIYGAEKICVKLKEGENVSFSDLL